MARRLHSGYRSILRWILRTGRLRWFRTNQCRSLHILRLVYLPVIRMRLEGFRQAWNKHKIRMEKNKAPEKLDRGCRWHVVIGYRDRAELAGSIVGEASARQSVVVWFECWGRWSSSSNGQYCSKRRSFGRSLSCGRERSYLCWCRHQSHFPHCERTIAHACIAYRQV